MRNWFVKTATVLVLITMAGIAMAGSAPLNATAEDGILVFESDDSAFKWWVDARVYVDMATYFDDGGLYNVPTDPDDLDDFMDDYGDFYEGQDSLAGGLMIRRARFAIKSQLWHNWYGEVDMDFAEEAVALKDAYLSYRGIFGGNGRIRVGNFRQPVGLEEVTTSRNLMFMERSVGTEPFVVGRRLGLELTGWYPKFRWTVSAFGADVEEYVKYSNERISFAARLNWTPIRDETSTLHIGASGTIQKPPFSADPAVKFNTRPETNVSDTKFAYAKIKDIDNYNVWGGELAYANKRFLVQGEFMGTKVSRLDNEPSVSYSGGYGFVSYFLTDDTHKYDGKDGEFARVVPTAKGGAWEVAVRYSSLSLNDVDADEMNGKENNWTIGVNYYPNANVKLMLNYGMVDNDEYATGKDDQYTGDYDFQYLQMRFQTAF